MVKFSNGLTMTFSDIPRFATPSLSTSFAGVFAVLGSIVLPASEVQAATVGTSSSYYFVQPVVQYGGGGIINGLEENGATSSTQSYSNAPVHVSSSVDLEEGTFKHELDISGPDQVASTQGIMGETVTFYGGADTEVTISLGIEGDYFFGASDPLLNPNLSNGGIYGYLVVFDASLGMTADTYFSNAFSSTNPDLSLDKDVFSLSLGGNTTDLSDSVNELLTVSTTLSSNQEALSIFGNVWMWGGTSGQPIEISFDFSHTSTFDLETADGVTYASASGAFLGGDTALSPVPLPASLPLLLAGLGGLTALRRRTGAATTRH